MDRSVAAFCGAGLDADLAPGEVVVATGIRRSGAIVPCPAAPFLAHTLRRSGIPSRNAVMDLDAAAPDLSGFVDLPPPADGAAPVGRGAAAVPGDPAAVAAARDAVRTVGSVHRPRTVLLASPRSYCAGVERAIDVVRQVVEQRGTPLYVRKQIVHNAYVVRDLERQGVVFVEELDEVPDGATVVFSAHGVSQQVRGEAARRRLDVIDATCPLVTKVHSEVRRFTGRDHTVVLIGHAGHEEVEGTLGQAPGRTVLVETPEDVERLTVGDPTRLSYVTQTTLAVDETTQIIDALRRRFPDARGPSLDDICYATTNRQDALSAVAGDSGLVLVVGSDNSSNSRRLVELSHRLDTPAHLIDGPEDIDPAWLAGVATVGVTAGASAPPLLVDQVLHALSGVGPVTVEERNVTDENVHFALPREVRRS